jgi:cardiolipin synthase A/B
MSAGTRRVRIPSLLFLILRRGFSPGRLLLMPTSLLMALHGVKRTVLRAVTPMRGHKTRQEDVPHPQLGEVQVGNNALQFYVQGRELYVAMLAAIDTAQESIYLEASIWKDDEVGRAFKRHLVQKVTEGVAVYVIFGGSGKRRIPHLLHSSPPTMHILGQRLFPRPWDVLDLRRYALDHRKLLVVDGIVGFLGGYNLGSRYAVGWRDTHLRIRGQAAAELAYAFTGYWNQHSVPHERITRRYARQFDPLIVVQTNDALRLTFPIRDRYIEAIDRAEQTILLTNASFVPDHSMLDALKAAVKRGVDVRVLVSWPSRQSLTSRVTCGAFTPCLQAGIRLFGYRPVILRAKTCTIDGQWSTIGSAHLDLLSSVVNYECNVEIYDASIASQMQELFACDTAGAVELSLVGWMNRPWYFKLSEWLLAPLRFLL